MAPIYLQVLGFGQNAGVVDIWIASPISLNVKKALGHKWVTVTETKSKGNASKSPKGVSQGRSTSYSSSYQKCSRCNKRNDRSGIT